VVVEGGETPDVRRSLLDNATLKMSHEKPSAQKALVKQGCGALREIKGGINAERDQEEIRPAGCIL
jgi:hypothetical protein